MSCQKKRCNQHFVTYTSHSQLLIMSLLQLTYFLEYTFRLKSLYLNKYFKACLAQMFLISVSPSYDCISSFGLVVGKNGSVRRIQKGVTVMPLSGCQEGTSDRQTAGTTTRITLLLHFYYRVQDLYQLRDMEYLNRGEKIPHTGDTNSLDRCGQQDRCNFERLCGKKRGGERGGGDIDNKHTDRQTDIVTTRPTRPRGPSW